MKYKISIITINYNNINGLKKTYHSVKNQGYDNIEYILVDGNSDDGSVNFLRENEAKIDHLIIEKDNGIYDAMNKGLDKCTGDFCLFLNSGDSLHDNDTLQKFVKEITDKNILYFGRSLNISGDINWLYPNNKFGQNTIQYWLKTELPCHQAIFFPKSFYFNERYNLKYKIGSDTDYKYRAFKHLNYKFLNFTVCNFYLGGISTNNENVLHLKNILKDSLSISLKYKGLRYALIRQIKLISKFTIKKIIGEMYFKVLQKYRK